MEAKSAARLPGGAGAWQYEPKWDGFRCLAFKAHKTVDLRAKSGKPLGRYFPEVVAMLSALAAERFVLDGEQRRRGRHTDGCGKNLDQDARLRWPRGSVGLTMYQPHWSPHPASGIITASKKAMRSRTAE
jgi:hypothetical protein